MPITAEVERRHSRQVSPHRNSNQSSAYRLLRGRKVDCYKKEDESSYRRNERPSKESLRMLKGHFVIHIVNYCLICCNFLDLCWIQASNQLLDMRFRPCLWFASKTIEVSLHLH